MKRRLMIARALVHEPRLLILDEPTAGVDIELRRSLWEFLREINGKGTTVILTTHYLEEAEQLCRNIVLLLLLGGHADEKFFQPVGFISHTDDINTEYTQLLEQTV
jgi:ABC-type multidrug transport system ATPase subunit